MLTGTSAPITIRHDRPVSESVWESAFPLDGQSSGRPGRETRGRVETQELSPGLFLLHSELRFDRETELREEYPESGVFQLSFCLSGCMEWEFEGGRGGKYAIAPTECSLQWGRFSRCTSYYQPGDPCRTLGIVMERERFQELTQQLETAHLIPHPLSNRPAVLSQRNKIEAGV